jgi:hypothetical protein
MRVATIYVYLTRMPSYGTSCLGITYTASKPLKRAATAEPAVKRAVSAQRRKGINVSSALVH